MPDNPSIPFSDIIEYILSGFLLATIRTQAMARCRYRSLQFPPSIDHRNFAGPKPLLDESYERRLHPKNRPKGCRTPRMTIFQARHGIGLAGSTDKRIEIHFDPVWI